MVASKVKTTANNVMSKNIKGVNVGCPKRKARDKSAPQLKGLYCATIASC